MKITAQLALSQMKVNKKRTIAGIFAIALATSLITTVMCFVTSANKMLTDFLGLDYGEYGGAYSLMLAIPALLLGLLIAAMSITVISNIFSATCQIVLPVSIRIAIHTTRPALGCNHKVKIQRNRRTFRYKVCSIK